MEDDELSLTAYAVLGVLSMNGELLTAGEIKQRATYALRFFWGSPAVSHIRRELQRMLALGLVEEHEIPLGGVRRAQAYQTTGPGERRLRDWVAQDAADDAVVIRNPLLLRIFLGRAIPAEDVLKIIDRRLRQVGADLAEVLQGRRRGDAMGLTPHPDRRFSAAVSDYTIRQLYFDQANLQQLRDTVAAFDAPPPPGNPPFRLKEPPVTR
ncbi:MarR family transcriptional regulator [Pseudosporangium ferrugineum]|uniref:PadR family transcriptional regulator n=1 Tax=Pseudosporangium ferrugineum TaxID=439699 RepID=A0A2T0SIZ6_9ACTN|nr:MarR family transcriptional regulator [Pseudosporangium ferrugineum]PRY33374.1 PadR family transcriptional regulator [Pseudosporangium ferrugineum]